MDRINELLRKRGNLIDQMRALQAKADVEKRQMTAEEASQWDAMDRDQEAIDAEVSRLKKQTQLDELRNRFDAPPAQMPAPEQQHRAAATNSRGSEEYRGQYSDYLSRGFRANEHRSLQADSQVGGGYMVAPEQFVNELIEALKDLVFVRQFARVIPVQKAVTLGVPVLESRPDDADWTVELKTGKEDSAMAFGKRELHPHPAAKRILVSNFLLQNSSMSIDAIVRDQLGYKFGITQEKAFLLGTGQGQPLGLFTPSADGIPTTRDFVAGTTTALTGDGLIDVKYSLKAQYQTSPTVRWIFHRDAVKQIRKIKNVVDGQYIWQPGLASDKTDTILDIPFSMSEYCPNTFTAGKYVGILGDFRFYWIADSMEFSIQVLRELYAETNQSGYIGRMECDGLPVLSEAWSRVALHA